MKKKKSAIKKAPFYSIIISVFGGIISLIIFFYISAFIMTKYDIPNENLKFFWYILSVLSGLIIGLFAGKLSKSKGVIKGTFSSLLVSLLTVCILTLFSNFNPEIIILIILPLFSVSGFFGALISSNLRK